MADLLSLLVQSGNSLAAQSAVLATAGNNVANANTPGYARQRVNLVANPSVDALGAGGVGTGVSVQSVTQARDQFIERQIPNALASQASSQMQSDALQSIDALDPQQVGGLPSALGAFYSSLDALSQNPGDVSARQSFIGASQSLAASFNQTASSIESARTGLDAKVQGDVNTVNNAAQSLAALNKQIQIAKAGGGQPNDLMDARQNAVDTLATLTGATPYTDAAGNISMALSGGMALVTAGGAGQLSAVPDPSNGGHLTLTFTRSDGSGPVAIAAASVGGELGGVFAARDGAMETAATAVDNLAFNFGTAVNTIHQAGFAMDGSTGRSLFTLPVTATGAASQITVNGAITADSTLLATAGTAPPATGDNSNVLALLATATQALAGGNNPTASLQKIVTDFGNSSAQAQAFAQQDGAMAANLTNLRDATSGVSVDEETVNLTQAQNAYAAVSRVIATANQMLSTLMAIPVLQ
jgi:flagellar hook-associated protein 1 FlgK